MTDVATLLSKLSPEQRVHLDWQRRWRSTARPNQIVGRSAWSECGYLAGRGFGKTRVGAEWITRAVFEDASGYDSCVIAPTYQDVKFTCFEGQAGILSVLPPELLVEHNKSDMIIKMRNVAGGVSIIRGFTAEKPERLRGPQHTRAWCDELAAWQYDEDTWDMMMMGMRLGASPQVLWTTTPKPKDLIRKLSLPKEKRIIVRGSTFDNKDNLPDSFFASLEQYEGTVLGRQELYGELIDPEENAVIKRSWLKLWPSKKPLPAFDWIIMSLDTAFTEATRDTKSGDADYTACSVWGVFQHDSKGYAILLDCWQEQLGMPDLIKRVKKEMNTAYGDDQDVAMIKPMYGSSKPLTSGRKPDILLIEDKGSGISLRQMLEREGILAHAYNPGRADKLARLHVVSPVFARRRVFLPESDKFPGKPRVWADPLVAQLCSFTGKGSIKHDDFVDSTTQAMRLMMDKGMLGTLVDKKQEFDKPPPKVIQNPYGQ
jgi:predicted phage terminase large subunit-like protein